MIRTYDKFLFNTFLRLNAVELKFLLRIMLLMDNAVLFHMLEYIYTIEHLIIECITLRQRLHYINQSLSYHEIELLRLNKYWSMFELIARFLIDRK